jgi:hypothetical protein
MEAPTHFRAYAGPDVFLFGDTPAADFDAGDVTISKIVFYGRTQDDEIVVGEVDVNASGHITASCP